MKSRFKGCPVASASLLVATCFGFVCLETLRADCVAAPSGLIGWWRAENNASDTAGTNHGTLLNGTTFAPGLIGQAFNFNASSNAGVLVDSAPELNPVNAITIEAWVKPFSFPNTGPTVVRKDWNATGATQYGLMVGDGISTGIVHMNIAAFLGGGFVSGGSVPTNVWTHVAGTYDRQFIRIYVNGVEVGNVAATAAIPSSSQPLAIGKEDLFSDRNFDGLIDELAIYNRALGSNEIAAIFAAGSACKCPPSCAPAPRGLIHWYRAESDGSDSAGTNNGSLEAGVTAGNAAQVGEAFRFNGTNGGVNLGNVPDLDFTADSNFTIEAWINPFGPTIQQAQYIVALNYQCSPTDQELAMYNSGVDAGKVGFFIRDANFVAVNTLSPAPLTTNTFHHVAGVREVIGITKTLKLYVDGVLVATTNDVTTGALAGSGADYIGRRFPCPDASTFNGLIDEVSIYNRALAANEIAAIFGAGSAGKCVTPSLAISLTTTNTAVVSWPSPSTDFNLQQNTNNVGSVNWSNIFTTPTDNGTNKFIIVNPPTGNSFYRLFKP